MTLHSLRTCLWISPLFLLLTAFPAVLLSQQKTQAQLNAALMAAIRQNDTQEARSLLQQGADPNAQEAPSPNTTYAGKPAASLLAPTGLFVALGWRGDSAYAVPENLSLLQTLLDKGANVHVRME